MGNCVQPRNHSTKSNIEIKPHKLAKNEEQLLILMYNDLAMRSQTSKLTRQNFDVFFHLNGLWGQEVFNTFDVGKTGQLSFQQFKLGIQLLVKGSNQEKVQALFRFYDIHKTNGISYEELLKMLYSYPKEELKKMIDDEKFLNDMNIHERYYHFGKHKVLDDARQVVQQVEQQCSSEKNLSERNVSEKDNRSSDATKDQEEKRSERKSNKLIPTNATLNKQLNSCNIYEKKKSGSISYFNSIRKKNFKVTSNLSLIVKKYATYLFKQFNLDKEKDELSQAQFMVLVDKHNKLFTSYVEGFHTYIWQADQKGGLMNKKEKCWIESPCRVEDAKTKKITSGWIKFIKMTLFIYQKLEDQIPIEIKNMEGLQVEEYNYQDKYGLAVKHRDGIYPQKYYYFDNQSLQQQWLRNLKDFKSNSIYDLYRLIQRIGTGNYSVVYRGIEKATQKQVAIKVIQKEKLTETQKNVIQHECQILALCHHPCIVKFQAKLQTKTHIYIVTEYLSEGGLEEYIRKKGYLEQYEASLIVEKLIETLIYLNSLGLIHRDMKPENIMVKLNKEKNFIEKVKIIDFGFAIFKDSLKDLKGHMKFAGTPGFLAPQVILLQDYDESIDAFSIGVIMYFMLSGILPFDSPSDDEVIKFTLRCNRIRLENAHWSNISENGKDLLKRLLSYKCDRISLEDAIKHPWITERQDMISQIESKKKL